MTYPKTPHSSLGLSSSKRSQGSVERDPVVRGVRWRSTAMGGGKRTGRRSPRVRRAPSHPSPPATHSPLAFSCILPTAFASPPSQRPTELLQRIWTPRRCPQPRRQRSAISFNATRFRSRSWGMKLNLMRTTFLVTLPTPSTQPYVPNRHPQTESAERAVAQFLDSGLCGLCDLFNLLLL